MGFTLLYFIEKDVTYSECAFNSTTPDVNYCKQVVYLVPMVIIWLSAILIIYC